MTILKWLGLYLIIDALISIYLASIGNVTLSLSFISSNNLFLISYIGRFIRIVLGIYLLSVSNPKNVRWIGAYLFIDAICSIILANEFNSWDDYLRISRAIVGGYLFLK